MTSEVVVRPIAPDDFDAWLPLWDAYNAFYGRAGETAISTAVTQRTWANFFNPEVPVFAFVAESDDGLLGLTHYLFHESTSLAGPVCYLQDLFTVEAARGRGVGRALISAVHEAAAAQKASRLYWHTFETNSTARLLYDKVAQHKGAIVYTMDM